MMKQARVLDFIMEIDERDGLGRKLLKNGIYELREARTWRAILRPGATAFDIGAHWGYYSIQASKIVGEGGCVVAVEPEPMNYGMLCRNLDLNRCSNVKAMEAAVDGPDLSDYPPGAFLPNAKNSGAGRLLPGPAVYPLLQTIAVNRLSLLSLLRLYPKANIVKCDTQGAEAHIFCADALEELRRREAKIIFEYWPRGLNLRGSNGKGLLANFINAGFALFRFDKSGLELLGGRDPLAGARAGHTNLFARPREVAP